MTYELCATLSRKTGMFVKALEQFPSSLSYHNLVRALTNTPKVVTVASCNSFVFLSNVGDENRGFGEF